MESVAEDVKDVWLSGRRLAKVLDARHGGVCFSPWKDLLPGLQHGELLCACRNASIFDLVKSHIPSGYYRPDGVEPVETRQDWKILAKAWQTSSKISGGLHGFKSRFQYCALDTETNLRFLDRSDVVEVITTGVTFNRASIVEHLDLTPEEVIILDGGEAKQDETQHEPQSLPLKLGRASGAGAKTDAVRWAQYGAALAVLNDQGRLDLTSENRAHQAIAGFLSERGHDDFFSIDTVRPLLRRFKAWLDEKPFVDDADFEPEE